MFEYWLVFLGVVMLLSLGYHGDTAEKRMNSAMIFVFALVALVISLVVGL